MSFYVAALRRTAAHTAHSQKARKHEMLTRPFTDRGPSRLVEDHEPSPDQNIRREFFIWKASNFRRLKRDSAQKLWTSACFRWTLCTTSNRFGSSMPRPVPLSSAEKARVYRQRLRDAGGEEVLFKLPRATVVMLDDLKRRQGLRNRSQALLQLIEQKGAVAQQTT
jgi:hypothetical protein